MLSFNVTTIHAWEKPDNLQIHGFISQSYINTSANNFFGNSVDRGTFKYREIGLNSSIQINPDFYLYGQLLFRQTGSNNDNNLRLDHGIIDYTLYASQRNALSIRGGRVKIPYGFYNETRDVPITRPSIFLPQSIYFDRTRNLALSGDGIGLLNAWYLDSSEISLVIVALMPNLNSQDTKLGLFRTEQPGELKPNKPTYITQIKYSTNNEQFRALFNTLLGDMDYKSTKAEGELSSRNIQFVPWVASIQFTKEFWSITAEYAQRTFTTRIRDSSLKQKITGESYYIQGSYRLSNQWELMLRYDVLYQDINDKTGTKAAAKFPTTKQAHNLFAKDWTLGLSWFYNKHILIRSELHNINGTGWLPISDNPSLNQTKQKWRLFSLAASYNF